MNSILLGLSDFGLYNVWLWTLALNLASSLILVHNYTNSKGTPIGRNAFYFSINSFLWTITSMIITIPILERNNLVGNYFYLSFPFLAAIALSLGTYERTRIQILLTPGTEEQTRDNRLWFILSFCIFAVALIGVISTMLHSHILNMVFRGMGGLTGLGFILIAGLFIALIHPKFTTKLVYVGSAILLILGFTVISGTLLDITALYSPLPGGPTTEPTALVFIITGLLIVIAKLPGLKWWIVRITMAMAILSTIVIQLVSYFFPHYEFLSYPELLLTVLVGVALLWRSWKTPNR